MLCMVCCGTFPDPEDFAPLPSLLVDVGTLGAASCRRYSIWGFDYDFTNYKFRLRFFCFLK